MSSVQVKVCGMTRPGDAKAAVALGVDMLGFIFVRRSPRYVSVAQAAAIISGLPPTMDRVGVFADGNVEQVVRTAGRLRLDWVQLHGTETARDISRIKRDGFKTIKAFTIRTRLDYEAVLRCRADLVLLDHGAGGTGKTFDWSLKPPRRIPNLVLAGGLDAGNVARGVELFRPLVVDVNSGVETSPGKKSAKKLAAFMREIESLRKRAGRE